MRADLHRLYDTGYVTVTPDLRFEVSKQLRDEFENGRLYYGMHGQEVNVPSDEPLQPSRLALDWHRSELFRG